MNLLAFMKKQAIQAKLTYEIDDFFGKECSLVYAFENNKLKAGQDIFM